MLKLFSYDNMKKEVVINEADVLLIKEFADLWTNERNETKKDPTGKNKTKAFREFTYIYCAIDWSSPYAKYSEQERHEEALRDGGLEQEEFDDEVFRCACRKYKLIQETSKIGKLLQSQKNMVDRMTIYFDNLDFDERDTVTGKPIFRMKDVLDEMSKTGKALENIEILEESYKKEQEKESSLRGGRIGGRFDS